MTEDQKKRDQTRTENNKEAGLVKISPSYWVVSEERDNALADIKRVMTKYQKRAKKMLEKHKKT